MYPSEPTAESFTWQMELLARYANPIGLDEAVRRLAEQSLPSRAVAVTFDDGYADNVALAAPILRRAGVPATFFVATGYLDGGRMWNDTVIESIRRATMPVLDLRPIGVDVMESLAGLAGRRGVVRRVISAIKHQSQEQRDLVARYIAELVGAPLPNGLMMREADVRYLSQNGMTIGAHTVTHPILAVIEKSRAEFEISASKRRLETIIGRPVTLFAYPNGRWHEDYRSEHVDMVRRLGFEAAVSTNRGAVHAASDTFQLPRFSPWDSRPERFLGRLLWEFRNAA